MRNFKRREAYYTGYTGSNLVDRITDEVPLAMNMALSFFCTAT